MAGEKKMAILFPGIGYTCDRPLLHFAGKQVAARGYEVKKISYSGFPKDIKKKSDVIDIAYEIGCKQVKEQLDGTDWNKYGDILFISKSVGTVIASAYAKQNGLKVRSVLYTPVVQTFDYAGADMIAFHGTNDPWAKTPEIRDLCGKYGIPLYLTENANHSLETGDVFTDIETLYKVMKTTEEFIKGDF